MLDVILTYDDTDIGSEDMPGLDCFFEACALDFVEEVFDINATQITEVAGKQLSLNSINSILDSKNQPFLLVAYSHGSNDSLLCNNQTNYYIRSGINDDKFPNCIFYTWSCFTGIQLGKTLIQNNCRAFIGYEGTIIAGTGEIESFIESANSGIKLLVDGKNIKQVLSGMYGKYNELIDYLENEKQDYFIASLLRRNRDELVYYGDENMTISEVIY